MLKSLLLSFSLILLAGNAWATTKPTDMITILKITGQDTTEKSTVYKKTFSQLVLSAQEKKLIASFNAMLDNDWIKHPDYQYHLTHLRLHEDQVQILRFENNIGDTVMFHLYAKSKCVNFLGGNGGPVAACEQY